MQYYINQKMKSNQIDSIEIVVNIAIRDRLLQYLDEWYANVFFDQNVEVETLVKPRS